MKPDHRKLQRISEFESDEFQERIPGVAFLNSVNGG